MRPRILARRRDAHQARYLESVLVAAGAQEGLGLGAGDAGLLRLVAGVDLDQQGRAAALLAHRLGERGGEARAVAVLVRSQFRNDLRFRMGVLAILPLTLLYLLIGMSGGRGADGARVPDLALVSMAVLLFPLMLKAQLAHSEAFRAAWIFFATPADRSRLIQSAQRVVVAFFIVPYLVFVGALLAFFVDDLVWLAGWLVVVGLMSNLVLLAETLVKPVVPFSLPPGKMEGTSKMIWIMILVGVLGGVLPFLVGWLASNPGKLGAAAAALIAASVIFARLVRLRVERAATQLEYQA